MSENESVESLVSDLEADTELAAAAAAAGKEGVTDLTSVEALAELYHRADRRDEAEAFYLRSVSLWEELLGPEQPRIGIPIHNLAVLHLEDCRVDEALPLIARVVELWERTLGADHAERVNAIRSEANGLRSCGRDEEAAELESLLKLPAGSATATATN